MHERPLIGITSGFDYKDNKMFLNKGYSDAINKCGGASVILSLTDETTVLDELINRCDGFLISGGPDVDAKYFGEDNLTCGGEISPYRDTMEIYLVKKSIENQKPILGICRGIQIMNIAMGGTIHQDIYSKIKDREVIKHSQSAPVWYPTHNLITEQNTKLSKIFKDKSMRVNSFHHQAVNVLSPMFKVSARSSDGIIESIEHENHPFAIGVQWHPELMWQQNEVHLGLFLELVEFSAKHSCRMLKQLDQKKDN
jgi:putative glutamine amidotransferase